MALGVTGLAVGLAVGGLLLVVLLGYALQRTVDDEAFKTADAVARLATQDALPDPLPVAGGQVRVQVVAAGRIRAASIDADRLVPMLYADERARIGDRGRITIPGQRLGMRGPVRVVAVTGGPAGDPWTVLVAKSMADVVQGVRLLRDTLLVAFPLLVALLAVVAWRVVGATLRPVEALRAGAEEITRSGRPGELPVPAWQDEIHRLAVTLNGMLARLESARVRQRSFIADAAHELRSPLANMRTQLEVAQRLGPGTDWPALTEDLLADNLRLGRLVDDLLLLARTDEAPGPVGPGRAVELGALIAAVAAPYPAPPVRVQPPDGPLWTRGDPDVLGRIVANLLDNAVRHARDRVTVAVRADGAYQLITVTDDGSGIPAADRERVFGRFTRLDDARARDVGGAGLGLAIVADLVRRHAGTVTLGDAEPGVRAEVRLPAAAPPADAAPPAAAVPSPAAPPADAGPPADVSPGAAPPTEVSPAEPDAQRLRFVQTCVERPTDSVE
ncbi:cell wall metabolism sensor histidine kinase WalK [Plantactinospora sp. KBS50]|uniref:sensor histidine kinase n=1 Tax=Plantactinospora sp. KBS50 TaxID=2024580 RepID=UPI000BAB1A31|nr:ATP-binding protein [Plantactinospora sp. KBS50]ASW57570.1 two-component sensor histidine kinase [Plantactinospora sp. KBS50]